MQHGGASRIPPGGLWGALPGSVMTAQPDASPALEQRSVTLGTAPTPRSLREMERVDPATTLKPERVDLAAPISVSEAAKATSSDPHAGHTAAQTVHQVPGEEDPHAAHRALTQGTNATQQHTAPAATYVCPMHPEVVSNEPGRCPKCGMALEKKEKK